MVKNGSVRFAGAAQGAGFRYSSSFSASDFDSKSQSQRQERDVTPAQVIDINSKRKNREEP